MVVIAVKPPKLPSFPPKFATFIFIEVILVPVHVMPCQSSPQGSPPLGIHPGSLGDPSETYSPFMAETSASWVSARARGGANAAAASRASSTGRSAPPRRNGARLIAAPDCSDHPTRRGRPGNSQPPPAHVRPGAASAVSEPPCGGRSAAQIQVGRRSDGCGGVVRGVGRPAAEEQHATQERAVEYATAGEK